MIVQCFWCFLEFDRPKCGRGIGSPTRYCSDPCLRMARRRRDRIRRGNYAFGREDNTREILKGLGRDNGPSLEKPDYEFPRLAREMGAS